MAWQEALVKGSVIRHSAYRGRIYPLPLYQLVWCRLHGPTADYPDIVDNTMHARYFREGHQAAKKRGLLACLACLCLCLSSHPHAYSTAGTSAGRGLAPAAGEAPGSTSIYCSCRSAIYLDFSSYSTDLAMDCVHRKDSYADRRRHPTTPGLALSSPDP